MKVLFLVFLCLFSISTISNVATASMDTSLECSQSEPASTSTFILDGDEVEPDGTGKGGGGWPK